MIRGGAAVLLAAVLGLAGCADVGRPGGPGGQDDTGGWTALPPLPVAPRDAAVTAWTGSEVLVLGGDAGPPCLDTLGAAGDCQLPEAARDGAAFDPAAGTWRGTAEAPVPLPGDAPSAVDGDTVYVLVDGRLFAYDASDDAWAQLPPIPGAPEDARLVVVDGLVVVVPAERRAGEPSGAVHDPAGGTWTALPEDPLGPTFDRVATATTAGLVLTAHTLVPDPGAEEPSLVRAAVLDRASTEWTDLGELPQLGGWRWAWTGRRMVDPSLGSADGGETNNYGRAIPIGGTLDPATGAWTALPDAPAPGSGGWSVEAFGGPLTALGGWLYDDRARSWTRLSRPQGAPPEPGSAVWAGERLFVVGGVDPSRAGTAEVRSSDAWMWTPGRASAEQTARPADLGGAWALRRGTAGAEEIPLPDWARATLEFAGDRVGGTAFCNDFGGTYTRDGDALVLEDVASTLVLCEGEVGAAESSFMSVLMAADVRVDVGDGELVLTSGGGTLHFHRLPPVPVDELAGVRWVLETVGTLPAVGEPALLELGDDGSVTLSTGCQTMRGTWTTSGDSVHLADHVYDPEACPEAATDSAAQHAQVTQLLSGGFQVTVEGAVLTVRDVDNRGAPGPTLVYRAR